MSFELRPNVTSEDPVVVGAPSSAGSAPGLRFAALKDLIPTALAVAVVAFGCVLTSGCGDSDSPIPSGAYFPADPARSGGDRANSIVQVGDRVEVYILEDESFNGAYLVRDGGHIIFPKVGRVMVSGKSLPEAELAVKNAFESDQLRTATVIMERFGERRQMVGKTSVNVFLSGALAQNGQVTIPYVNGRAPTVYQAVLYGGGFAQFANQKRASVLRQSPGGPPTSIPINLADVARGKAEDVPLREGDIIIVPQKAFGF